MRKLSRQWFYSFQISILMVLKPSVLFTKINQLDWYRTTLQKWINVNNFPDTAKILEVGCATGSVSEYMTELGYDVVGIDTSAAMISAAKLGKHDAKYYVANAYNLPFADNTFDAVVSSSVINIVSDQSKALTEMKRVCKQGGTVTALVLLQPFESEKFKTLVISLGVSGFSEAALVAWYKYAPKMNKKNISTLFQEAELRTTTMVEYLDGMVFSISSIK